LREQYPAFQERGAEVVVVTTTDVPTSKLIAEDLALPYPLLSDPEWVVFKGYGTGAALGVPLPAQFLIDSTGRVVERYLCDLVPDHPPLDVTLGKIPAR
jgi:peroxiredoxin